MAAARNLAEKRTEKEMRFLGARGRLLFLEDKEQDFAFYANQKEENNSLIIGKDNLFQQCSPKTNIAFNSILQVFSNNMLNLFP